MYEAEVIADSMSPHRVRLTTVLVKYPHAVHKDMLRHRNQSRSVESFRARPTELLIKELQEGDAFWPDVFAGRVKGMGQGAALEDQEVAQVLWETHVLSCLATASALNSLDVAKQQCNFVLQDLCPLVEIITATDWGNFFALRLELNDDGDPVARPEVFKTVVAIKQAIEDSTPEEVPFGQWHLPLVGADETMEIAESDGWSKLALISAGRCARISYDKHREQEPIDDSIARAARLIRNGHMSPFEHQARPMRDLDLLSNPLGDKIMVPARAALVYGDVGPLINQAWCGNFRSWVQQRKLIANEHDYGLMRGEEVQA